MSPILKQIILIQFMEFTIYKPFLHFFLYSNALFTYLLYLLRDPHGIATRRDKIISIVMIILAIFANAVAVSSDVYSIFHKS